MNAFIPSLAVVLAVLMPAGLPLAASVAAQEPAAPETASPFGSDPTPDQVIQFFTLFSADEGIAAALEPLVKEIMQPGEMEEGWEDAGIDILADLAAMEGGPGAFLLRDTDTEVLSAVDLFARSRPDLARFESYALRPEPVGLVEERVFLGAAPGIWLETAHQRERRGNALCYSGYIGVTLHSDRPVASWREQTAIEIATYFALIDQLAREEACNVYKKRDDGTYITRTYRPDGTRLALLDAETTPLVPMPASEIDAFLSETPGGLVVPTGQ
ncbi:hypothetical protein Ga0102493_11333 [Erythrobacter litoralis]|uniref:Uncharacterized protein n=2 Tax=Erythrobacter litoralis TaxID=39960 RepID=A0A074N5M8_9SPHN|nr:hypothetical protein [Erythrobacter litoralis]AOL24475.1 hypothetical protein Ga0102493_11333 [Erythrobacter litoralis]KEO93287.1 hypothetical protein EH32_11230 [Erythrobacter litoralis]